MNEELKNRHITLTQLNGLSISVYIADIVIMKEFINKNDNVTYINHKIVIPCKYTKLYFIPYKFWFTFRTIKVKERIEEIIKLQENKTIGL